MKWWSKFWKIRKQEDKVKLMVLFLLIGIGFLGHFIYEGGRLYQAVMTPAEYVLVSQAPAGVTNGQMTEIWELEPVSAVSRQQEQSLELSSQRGKMTLTCLEVSQSYLEIAYGIREYSSMQVFYVNSLAYEELLRAMGYSNEEEIMTGEDWHMGYVLGGEETGMAKIIVVTEGIPNDQPYAFHEGDSVSLAKNPSAIRVQVRQQDLDGRNVRQLRQSGLELVNEGTVQKTLLFQERELLRMKYDFFIAALCLLFVICLKIYGK